MKIINIGIVAHVDAGKTSLTERILFETGIIRKLGRVDHGNTQTDSLAMEQRRGITIKASVVSFLVNDFKINLIDTPGHADFIAEVERSFRVLDGAILVISAVEGIQAQTRLLMSILKQLEIPTIIFINKIDRAGAQSTTLIKQIQEKLVEPVLPLFAPQNSGTKEASIVENGLSPTQDPPFWERCMDLLTRHDEPLLEAYVNEEAISEEQVRDSMARQVQSARLVPVYFGSAMMGVGATEVMRGVTRFFPSNSGAEQDALSAVVFKIEREDSGEKIAYVRVYAGTLRVREEVQVSRKNYGQERQSRTEKVKLLHLFQQGKSVQADQVTAGDFCKIWGINDVKIGDVVGEPSEAMRDLSFVSPQLETRIEAAEPEQHHKLYQALVQLSEEDPLVKVIKEIFHGELYLQIFGEVQKEVLEAELLERYDVAVRFSETRVVCIEKPVGSGQSVEEMGAGSPFVATVGLRVEPGEPGSGIRYGLETMLGSLPLPLHRAIEETVHETLKQGIYGWEVTDINIFLTHSGYSSVASTAGDFRKLVPLVLMDALTEAGTAVYEPLNEFELSGPVGSISQAMYRLTTADAIFGEPVLDGETFQLTGSIPVITTEEFKRTLSAFTEGEGVFLTRPSGFRPIEGEFPTRKRADYNPLNRREYLLHVAHAY